MDQIYELQYALDTFYFLVCGALVMWMAAGFSMLEAGLVRSKNTSVILAKNIALFSISCVMYLVCGYAVMYGGGIFLSGIELDGAASADAAAGTVRAPYGLEQSNGSASEGWNLAHGCSQDFVPMGSSHNGETSNAGELKVSAKLIPYPSSG